MMHTIRIILSILLFIPVIIGLIYFWAWCLKYLLWFFRGRHWVSFLCGLIMALLATWINVCLPTMIADFLKTY